MKRTSLTTLAGVLVVGIGGSTVLGADAFVDVDDFLFGPANVGIMTGDSVQWDWVGMIPHSTTSAAGFAESWDSGVVGNGSTFSYMFTMQGIYPYYCTTHGFDVGDGTVTGMSGYVSVFSGPDFELLGPVPGTAGKINQFAAGGALPGSRVFFVYSLRTGSTGVPGCPGLSVDLRGPEVFASVTSDAAGFVSLEVFVPGAAAGRTVYFQAVDLDGCQVSNLVTHAF